MNDTLDRRKFLKFSASAGAVLYASPLVHWAGNPQLIERKGAAKRVIVVGAGLAGLSAAYELTQAGHDVTILEARMRPGGRVLTLREPFSGGLYAEAGAARFPDTHDLTLKYVELFGLTLDPFYPSEQTQKQYSSQYHRGRRTTIEPGEEVSLLSRAPVELQPDEKKLGYSGLWKKFTPPELKELGDPAAPGWPPDSLKKYDQMTIAEFLREQGASPATIAALMFWEVDPADDTRSPLADYASSAFSPNRGAKHWFKIRGGMDLLPKAFAARLVEKIHYGAEMVRIEHDVGEVRVVFLQAGSHHRISADYLICAIPFSVLRDVEISPPFTPEKQRVIKEQLYNSHTRVFLQSRKRYWLEEGFDGFADTDVLGEIWHPTFDQPGPRGVLVSSLMGNRAEHVAAMTNSQRVSYAIEQMEKIFPGMRQHFESGASKAWGEDPWAKGAFAYFKAGQLTWFLPHLSRPEGRVHFAGTHTSPWQFGWMQGALASGNRTAREINEASAVANQSCKSC